MFSLIRGLFILVLCLVGIGLYRGWFSFSSPNRDPQSHNVNISVSIDAGKLAADVEEVKEKITEEVERAEQPKDGTTAQPNM